MDESMREPTTTWSGIIRRTISGLSDRMGVGYWGFLLAINLLIVYHAATTGLTSLYVSTARQTILLHLGSAVVSLVFVVKHLELEAYR